MSLKFEGEITALVAELAKRVKMLEQEVMFLKQKPVPQEDEVSDWLKRRRKSKQTENTEPTNY